MSYTFTKLFSSITESTVWCENDRTRLVWICLLAMADRKGRVFASIPGLANRARVPVEDARKAVHTFLSPDPDSRTPDHEGRRIAEIDGGWRLLNHEKYRAIRDEEAIRESKREYINTRRAIERDVEKVENVERGRHNAEADTEAEADADSKAKAESKDTRKEKTPAAASGAVTKSVGSLVFDAYAKAFSERYGQQPPRSASVNAKLAQFAKRLPADEAPAVAAFYVSHNGAFYVAKVHPVGLLLADAEKLRTEWAMGRTVNAHSARLNEKTAANPFAKMLRDEIAKEKAHVIEN